ncbi:putative serine/threonine-protein kinase PBL9 [Bidens hawaiensis]|uniref:putative serine/threonine-protein kinase PBL9 n=1 Tax=Bidens hawaiensis TaxID=980011 RepID=UPI00404B8BE4
MNVCPILEIEEPLSWELKINVAKEDAQGHSYLHASESRVIYRSFKCSNIPLDMDYNVKLLDFGLAKTDDMSHVTTQVMGTEGHTAPEYIATGRLTTKCDVYTFGIV